MDKRKTIALLLCIFTGWFGGHLFYLNQPAKASYLLFFWTGIPFFAAIFDFFRILLISNSAFDDRYFSEFSAYRKELVYFSLKGFNLYKWANSKPDDFVIGVLEYKEKLSLDEADLLLEKYKIVNDDSKVQQLLTNLISSSPEYYKTKYITELSGLYFKKCRYRECIELIQSLPSDTIKEEVKNGNYELIKCVGLSFEKLEMYPQAIEYYKKAPINSKEVSVKLNQIIMLLARAFEENGDKKNAIKMYQKALSHDIRLTVAQERINKLSE